MGQGEGLTCQQFSFWLPHASVPSPERALTAPFALADQALRVVTWNLETLGPPGSSHYQAVAAVLGRLDAEVVALQEIASSADAGYLRTLAKQLGYPYVTIAPGGPFGGLRNALLSDFPITDSTIWTSALLSGDALANDLTRFLPEVRVDVSGRGHPPTLVPSHLKSGGENSDAFRRALEGMRGEARGPRGHPKRRPEPPHR
ncbi:MAG: endonuclease/exonuclease/phosphatase family protein [Chromatiaceae bacterium]|nr:endonuclease/exonuclease/phosphatase family protein [Chromatiaceae bacterium]